MGRLWSAGWALALATVLASLLIGLGGLPAPLAAGLAVAALPGLAGALFVRELSRIAWAPPLWTLATALATGFAGGVVGPLAPLLFGPLAASLVFGFPATTGLWASLGAFGLAALGQAFGLSLPVPPDPAALLATGASMLVAVIGLAAAAAARSRRLRARLFAANEDQNFFLELPTPCR